MVADASPAVRCIIFFTRGSSEALLAQVCQRPGRKFGFVLMLISRQFSVPCGLNHARKSFAKRLNEQRWSTKLKT